jgi:hypothetical protein
MLVRSVPMPRVLLASTLLLALGATPALAHGQTSAAPEPPTEIVLAPLRITPPTALPLTLGVPPVGLVDPAAEWRARLAALRPPARTVPYRGGPIPIEARLVEGPRRQDIAAVGGVLFALAYAPSATVATGALFVSLVTYRPMDLGLLVFPVIGPFLVLAKPQDPGVVALLVLDSVVQTAGIVTIIVGLAMRTQWLVYDREDARTRGPRWQLAPTVGTAPGMALAVTF